MMTSTTTTAEEQIKNNFDKAFNDIFGVANSIFGSTEASETTQEVTEAEMETTEETDIINDIFGLTTEAAMETTTTLMEEMEEKEMEEVSTPTPPASTEMPTTV